MAKKTDREFFDDAKAEDRKQSPGASKLNGQAPPPPPPPPGEQKAGASPEPETKTADPGASAPPPLPPPVPPTDTDQDKENFKKKFDEFFSKNPMVSGKVAVEMLDDLKCNFFLMRAHEKGLTTMEKKHLAMAPEAKEMTAFLADYAIKNKLFSLIEKYPLLGALGIFALSAGSTYLMIEMLGNGQSEAQKAKAENEKLKKEIADILEKQKQERRAAATTVEPVSETTTEPAAASDPAAESDEVRDFAKTL